MSVCEQCAAGARKKVLSAGSTVRVRRAGFGGERGVE